MRLVVKKIKAMVKKMTTRMNYEDGENNDRRVIKRFRKLFLKQSKKENSWILTTNCSTNHVNLLVIVVLHGSLAITSPWLQETIQSMTHRIILLHPNNTFIPYNKLLATIQSSK